MNPFHEQRIRGHGGFRIVAKNPKMFLRPVDQPRAKVPTPTARMAYPFSLGQVCLAAPQLLLRPLALDALRHRVTHRLEPLESVLTHNFTLAHLQHTD